MRKVLRDNWLLSQLSVYVCLYILLYIIDKPFEMYLDYSTIFQRKWDSESEYSWERSTLVVNYALNSYFEHIPNRRALKVSLLRELVRDPSENESHTKFLSVTAGVISVRSSMNMKMKFGIYFVVLWRFSRGTEGCTWERHKHTRDHCQYSSALLYKI